MTRINPDALATHLEVALSCAPLETLAALQDGDASYRCPPARLMFLMGHKQGQPRCLSRGRLDRFIP